MFMQHKYSKNSKTCAGSFATELDPGAVVCPVYFSRVRAL